MLILVCHYQIRYWEGRVFLTLGGNFDPNSIPNRYPE